MSLEREAENSKGSPLKKTAKMQKWPKAPLSCPLLLAHRGAVIILGFCSLFESNKLNLTNPPHWMVLTEPKRLQLSAA